MFAAFHQGIEQDIANSKNLPQHSILVRSEKLCWKALELKRKIKKKQTPEPFGSSTVAVGKYIIIFHPKPVIIDTKKGICSNLQISESPIESCEILSASYWKDNKIIIVGQESRAPDRQILHFGIVTISLPQEDDFEEEVEEEDEDLYDPYIIEDVEAEYEEMPLDTHIELDLKCFTTHLENNTLYVILGVHKCKGLFSGDVKELFVINLETRKFFGDSLHENCSLDHISYLHENTIHVHLKGPLSDPAINEEICIQTDKYLPTNEGNAVNTESEIRSNSELFPFNNPLFQYQIANGKICGFIHHNVEESNYQTLYIYDIKTKVWEKYEITGDIPQYLELRPNQMSGSIIVIDNEIYVFASLQNEVWSLSLGSSSEIKEDIMN